MVWLGEEYRRDVLSKFKARLVCLLVSYSTLAFFASALRAEAPPWSSRAAAASLVRLLSARRVRRAALTRLEPIDHPNAIGATSSRNR